MLVLDNDVLRKYTRPEPDENVVRFLEQRHAEEWATSALVAFEFYRIYDDRTQMQSVGRQLGVILDGVIPFSEETAIEAAALESSLASTDVSLDVRDLLHAAVARDLGETFVTGNRNDFDNGPVRELVDVEFVDDESE